MRRRTSVTAATLVVLAAWFASTVRGGAIRPGPPTGRSIEFGPSRFESFRPGASREGSASEEGSACSAAAKGKPSLTAYYAKGFSDATWQQAAFGKVAKSWVATAPPALGKKTVVISQITREGKVLDAKIGTPSGSEAWDKAALEAVRKAAPFAALPKTWMESGVEIHWHFAYAK